MDGRKKKFIKELLEKPRARRSSGLFIVDGPKMCAEIPPEQVEEIYVSEGLLASEHAGELSELLGARGFEVISDRDMKQISDTVTPQGIIALVRQRRTKGLGEILESIAGSGASGLIVGLEAVQDPGNVGTILRSAEAAGASAVICDRDCADIYAPKVVRSTMGAVLRLPVLQVEDLCVSADRLRQEGFEVLAAHLKGSRDYDMADLTGPSYILIGNESRGLSEELSDRATCLVKIPMLGHTESLNAAVAASVILFEAARQRRRGSGGC